MKRTISLVLSLVLLLALLPACSRTAAQPAPEPVDLPSAQELAETALTASGRDAALDIERLSEEEDPDRLAAYIEAVCGLTRDQWEDAAAIRGMGASAFEIVALRLGDEDAAGQTETVLTDYLTAREGAFTGYAPAEAEMAANGKVLRKGRTVGLFICPDPEGAEAMFTAACSGEELPPLPEPEPETDYPDRVRFTPPGDEDMSIYDTSAILDAWEKKDPSALRGYDREVYNMASDILPDEDLSDLEKEEAVYRWLVNNVSYDWTHQDALAETERWAYEPYGALVKRAAVCLGYATAFQLLMDMSGVECITVVGAAAGSTMDHAWNMVKLNGEWYCVDVAWGQQQLGGDYELRYFNITSDEMAIDHQWDYASTPEATAEDRGGADA